MQQYKYIKGSAADFVGAPDWAAYIARNHHGRAFVSRPGNKYSYIDGEFSYMQDIPGDFIKYPWIEAVEIIAQREPIPEWNGDGLPPVGVECEMQNDACDWIPVDIIANHDGFTFGWSYDYRMVYFSDKPAEFRPIRTEAERKREEAVAEMINLKDGFKDGDTYYHAIYDAIAAGKIPGIKLE